jgi:hypothetical protein
VWDDEGEKNVIKNSHVEFLCGESSSNLISMRVSDFYFLI